MKHFYEIKSNKIILKPLEIEDIEKLRVLRNKNASFFVDQRQITQEEQYLWYSRYLEKENDIMFKIVLADNPEEFVGAVGIYNIDAEEKTAEFGRIVVDGDKVSGIGKDIVELICQFAYGEIGLEKVDCCVFKNNVKAVHIYKKIGFEVIREEKALLFMCRKQR